MNLCGVDLMLKNLYRRPFLRGNWSLDDYREEFDELEDEARELRDRLDFAERRIDRLRSLSKRLRLEGRGVS